MDEGLIGSEPGGRLVDDVDALFKLPLTEFIGARNDLAARLKRAGRADNASRVKALAKPSISAWAVNQLYWKHREEFDRLLAAGRRVREAQTSHPAGRIPDLRESLDERRDALSRLSDLATVLLRDAGHSPTPDTIHRVTTSLEAISAHATLSDSPTPGRLTQDVEPPGFESLASLVQGIDAAKRVDELTRGAPPQKSATAAPKTRQRTSPAGDERESRHSEETRRSRIQSEETRRAGIAAAKVSLKEATRALTEAQSTAKRLEVAQKKAHAEAEEAEAEVRQAEKQLRDAEGRFKKASAASQDAAQRAQHIAAEAAEAAKSVEDARRAAEKASKELDSSLKEFAPK
jgi:DNA repair exonuclease SbcCD ATPase subunit